MLPTGTVTFLFTDIQGSSQLWEKHPEAMKAALAKHDAILREAIESNNGRIIKTTGDGAHAAFSTSLDAVNATLRAQNQFQSAPGDLQIKVRMGLHTGEAELRDGDYYGQELNRAARIMSVGHGGQILLSGITAALVREQLPQNTKIIDLGEHRLKSLSNPEHLWQLVAPGITSEFPALQSLTTLPNNLPLQLTSFVGREKEILEIKQLLNSARLVTLTGSGGTGKTRLSLGVGSETMTPFTNGVWLIELAPLTDATQIIPALAHVFGLQELPFNPLASLVMDYLRDKKLLLILDNCEHLIAACARLADDLLHQCVGLKILASSREALGIAGEVAYRTPSLEESESTRLFVERARAANSKFSLTDSNALSIAKICSRLDGIPLAIELAAARTKLFSVDQIAARLDDLFRLLVGGSRTALPRQQTLRALIDWSYDNLFEEEKGLLRIASVFVGGWTLDALEAVSDDPNAIEHLEGLVNKSLVVIEECNGDMRYFLLETIRQYAREKLFEAQQSSAARDRHFIYFDELSEKMWEAFRSTGQYTWRDRTEDEMENLRAAFEWGLEHHAEAAIGIAANFCVISGWVGNQTEGLAVVKSALERVRSLSPIEGEANIDRQKSLATALFAQGLIGMATGGALSLQALLEAISISRLTGDKIMLGYSLEMYFTASTFRNLPDGPDAAKEGFAIFSDVDDMWGMSMAIMNMGRIALMRGDVGESQKYFDMLKARLKDAPISFMSGLNFLGMGHEERDRGRLENAKEHFEEGRKIFRLLRHKGFETVMMAELGHIARIKGEIAESKQIYQQTIRRFQELGNRGAITHQLECFGFIALAEEEPQNTAKLFGAAEALREKIDSPMTDMERIEYEQSASQLRSMLPDADFNTLWAEGKSMTMEQAIQLALG